MTGKLPEDARLIAYLFDELPEKDRRSMEEQCGDDSLFEQLIAVEDELYDQYARGLLPAGRREVFERKFLATVEQRRKLAFARTLQEYRAPRTWFPWLQIPKLRVLVPAASLALLLLAAATSWQFRNRRGTTVPPPVQQLRQPLTVAFILSSGQTRDLEAAKPLVVPAGADYVRFEASLERDASSSYRAALEVVRGTQIWSQGGLQSQVADSRKFIAAVVAAGLLRDRDYILTLQGAAPNGDFSTVAEYYLRIERR